VVPVDGVVVLVEPSVVVVPEAGVVPAAVLVYVESVVPVDGLAVLEVSWPAVFEVLPVWSVDSSLGRTISHMKVFTGSSYHPDSVFPIRTKFNFMPARSFSAAIEVSISNLAHVPFTLFSKVSILRLAGSTST
jgi:hypothetical protein